MICLRCGHCCLTYAVVVVVDPRLCVTEENLRVLDGTERCPHLLGNEAPYTCAIHDHRWFRHTPCGRHGQIESRPGTPCRMGQYRTQVAGVARDEARASDQAPGETA